MNLDLQVRVTIGKIVVQPSRDGYIWLTWEDSAEGMEVPEQKLADCLERFYRENF